LAAPRAAPSQLGVPWMISSRCHVNGHRHARSQLGRQVSAACGAAWARQDPAAPPREILRRGGRCRATRSARRFLPQARTGRPESSGDVFARCRRSWLVRIVGPGPRRWWPVRDPLSLDQIDEKPRQAELLDCVGPHHQNHRPLLAPGGDDPLDQSVPVRDVRSGGSRRANGRQSATTRSWPVG